MFFSTKNTLNWSKKLLLVKAETFQQVNGLNSENLLTVEWKINQAYTRPKQPVQFKETITNYKLIAEFKKSNSEKRFIHLAFICSSRRSLSK